jgi:nucleoside-diphosphate-sugar epimerase
MKKIAITGYTGFVGKSLVPFLLKHYDLVLVSLRNSDLIKTDWSSIDTIIHLAGKAHDMKNKSPKEYFDVNHKLTIQLADIAKENKVKHFIFISTVKVYGDHLKTYYDENSICEPTDPYGKSKWMSEQDLMAMANDEFVVSIIRPPLVYGYDVKGNLQNLISLIRKYPFVPFGNINNKRSMVYLGNLASLIMKVIDSTKGGVFIAGDAKPYSTTELVDMIIKKTNAKTKNIALPSFLQSIIRFLKPDIYHRLFGDFIIDNKYTNQSLGFTPPFSFEEGIAEMVKNN